MRRALLPFSAVVFAACQCGGPQTMPASGRLVVAPTSLDFGQQETGSQAQLVVTLTNTGTALLEVSSSVSADARSAFSTPKHPLALSPGESQQLDVVYAAPATPGLDTATLSLETNALSTPEVLVPLTGRSAQPCVPRTCAELASACGTHPECGSTVDCGACASGACVSHRCVMDDGGNAADAGDAGGVDAGSPDSGADDAGPGDAGDVDAGAMDAGDTDAGAADAGIDGGATDAGFSVDPSRRYVFTTASSFTGSLGGLVGADAKCNSAASAARLPGTYRALVITSGQTLAQRVPDAGPWYRVDGQLAFQDATEVLGAPRVALNLTESGGAVTGYGSAWTGVIKYGGVSGSTCTNWTSAGAGGLGKAGDTGATTSNYIDDNPSACPTFDCGPSCSTALHLYCIAQ